MNTKPMIFTTENIRGIRDGRKTMTRRVIKPQPSEGGLEWCTAADGAFGAWQDPLLLLDEHSEDGGPCQRVCPYGVPGDLLWLREPHLVVGGPHCEDPRVVYRATNDGPDAWVSPRWTPSIFMPRRFSRLTLHVSTVRVERVQDISEENAKAEGVPQNWCGELSGWSAEKHGYLGTVDTGEDNGGEAYYRTAREAFAELWDSINAKRGYSYESNPWVWVIEWDRVWEKNVDAVIKELGA